MTEVIVRDAEPRDMDEIYQMLNDLMAYQELPQRAVDINLFKNDSGLISPNSKKYFDLFVAETKNGTLAGYVLYFYMYKTSKGKLLYIEDIFVKEEFRGKKVGLALMAECARRAKDSSSFCIKLQVLDSNPAKSFYERLGGKFNGTKVPPDWLEYEYDIDAIGRILLAKY